MNTADRFDRNLNLVQSGYAAGAYQPTLPGMEHLGDKHLPTNTVFRRPVSDSGTTADAWSAGRDAISGAKTVQVHYLDSKKLLGY